MLNKKTQKAKTLVFPIGLYNKLNKLAFENHLNFSAYCIKQLWTISKWDGKDSSNANETTK